ncbi:DUF6387 family protein [Vibrio parahaemolyticus]
MKVNEQFVNQVVFWLSSKDYSTVHNWTNRQFLDQINERLDLLDFALLNPGNIDHDIRWKQLGRGVVEIHRKLDSKPISAKMSSVYVEGLELHTIEQLELLSKIASATPNDSIHPDKSIELWRKQYLINERLFVSFRPDQLTNEAILKKVEGCINLVRSQGDIPEPESTDNAYAKSGIKRLMNHRSLMYLDICIYFAGVFSFSKESILKMHAVIASIMNGHPMYKLVDEVVAENIKDWTRKFYKERLLNSGWMEKVNDSLQTDIRLSEELVSN